MSFLPDRDNYSKCCTECGRVGVTRHCCPDCPCNYCKQNGHAAASCPTLELRRHRQKQNFNESTPKNSPHGAGNLQPRAKRPWHNASSWNTTSATGLHGQNTATLGNLDSQPPLKRPRNNSSSSNITSERGPDDQRKVTLTNVDIDLAIQALNVGNETCLPPLYPLANHVVQVLSSDDCPEAFLSFKPKIAQYSSARILTDIIAAIDTTIRRLESQLIDLDALRKVRETQKNDCSQFDCDGGYLDFITDTRSDTYFRMYIGQGKLLADRISQHLDRIANGDISTLHYYVLAAGGKSRTSNFIRLFRLKPDIFHDEEYTTLCRDLLELLMTLAFRTISKPELKQWLPEASITAAPLETIHLNVLNPLYQSLGQLVTYHVRQSSRDVLLASPDPQLARWPVVRKQQMVNQESQRTLNLGPYPNLHQMVDILRQAVEDNRHILGELDALYFPLQAQIASSSSLSMEDRLDQLRTQLYINETGPPLGKLYTPVGNVKSSLAIILNKPFILPKYDLPSSPDSFLPLAFEKMGLTDGQLLIWPFNLRHRSSLAPGDVSPENDDEAEEFKRFSFGLLNDSQAQFVLVVEGVAEEFIFNNNP